MEGNFTHLKQLNIFLRQFYVNLVFKNEIEFNINFLRVKFKFKFCFLNSFRIIWFKKIVNSNKNQNIEVFNFYNKKLKIVLGSFLVLAFFLTFASATQNLCNEAKAKGFDFAPDPSDCTRYLYCERDSANSDDETNIKSVHYLQCNQTSTHKYFKDGTCVTDDLHCQGSMDLCPPSGTPDYKVRK